MIGPNPNISTTHNPYYNNINSNNLGDKSLLKNYMTGQTVLDIGTGDGNVAQHLRDNDFIVQGLDSEPRKNVPYVIKGYAHQVGDLFGKSSFDNVLACSSFHEIFSFGNNNGIYGMDSIKETIYGIYNVLKSGGRFIIRDGVKNVKYGKYSLVLHNDWIEKAHIYLQVFSKRNYPGELSLHGNVLRGDFHWLSEFLVTGVWGLELMERESHEIFGWSTQEDIIKMVNDVTNNNMITVNNHAWTSSYYEKQWYDNTLELFDSNGNVVDFPLTHCRIVFEKL